MAGFVFKIGHIRLFCVSIGKINQPGDNSMQSLPK